MFLDDFINQCHINLLQPSSKLPLAYLVSRGLSIDDIKKYKIGYITNFTKNPEEDHEECPNFNKWLGSRGKFVKNRIVFPVYDELSNLKGIETRSLDKKAMSVLLPRFKVSLKDTVDNLPESEVRYKKFYFEKNKFSATFFGLPSSLAPIWEKEEVFLTEGIFDMIILNKIKNNCLSPLTANINQYQIEWLKRYVKKIILLFDTDEKGKKAYISLKKQLEGEIEIFPITLKGKDVNEYASIYGIKDFEMYLNDKLQNIF